MNTRMMSRVVAAATAAMTVGTLTMPAASASTLSKALGMDRHHNSQQDTNRQQDKNTMRNVGVGLGAAGVYELTHGNPGAAIVLGAGAALAGKKYNDQKNAQNQQNNRERGNYRTYQYQNGVPIGYDEYSNGQRHAYYSRDRNSDGSYKDSYSWQRNY